MPWKSTKLVFCGLAVRRRTLYVITLVCAIAAVPVMSLALLTLGGNYTRNQQVGLLSATIVTLAMALNGWRLILKHNISLFWEEARVIWPGAVVLLLAATWLGCTVADAVIQRGRMDYIVPTVFGGFMLVVLLVRWAKLGSHTKRSSIVRGDSGRRHSRSGLPAAPASEETVAPELAEDDDAGPEPPSGDSAS